MALRTNRIEQCKESERGMLLKNALSNKSMRLVGVNKRSDKILGPLSFSRLHFTTAYHLGSQHLIIKRNPLTRRRVL